MPSDDRIAGFIVTEHAARQIARRSLAREDVARVLVRPDERLAVRLGREVWQSVLSPDPAGRVYLLRVVVDVDREPPEIVTAYRTSKVAKYRRALS